MAVSALWAPLPLSQSYLRSSWTEPWQSRKRVANGEQEGPCAGLHAETVPFCVAWIFKSLTLV